MIDAQKLVDAHKLVDASKPLHARTYAGQTTSSTKAVPPAPSEYARAPSTSGPQSTGGRPLATQGYA